MVETQSFDSLYSDNNLFYVADASGLRCIDKKGNILWTNPALGIDGVVIYEFTDNKILGSGEFDPPGGWEDFAIDKKTGLKSV